jgi:RHS repeat-associated protein
MQEYEVIVNRDVVKRLLVYTADDERLLVYHAQADPISQWTIRGLDNKALRQCRYQNDTQLHYLERDYVYRNGQLLAAGIPGGRLHYHLDHLGSPRLITNQAGGKVAYHAYFPYGDELPLSEPSDERMRFTAHERDFIAPQSLGVDKDYLHAREYKPWMGRFLSTDPAGYSASQGQPQSWNRYSYVLNNPLNLVDPFGLAAECPTDNGAGTPVCYEEITVNANDGSVSGAAGNSMDTASRLALGRMQLEFVSSLSSAPVRRSTGPFPLIIGPLLEGAGRVLQRRTEPDPNAMAMMPLAPGGVRLWPAAAQGNVTINGITYSRHALERMSPVGLIQQGTHLSSRGVPPSVVENAIRYGTKAPGNVGGRVVHNYENVRVVTNTSGDFVFTVIKTGR